MGLLRDVGLDLAWYRPFVLYSDSQSAIGIANSKVQIVNKYSKHIERRVHWFRELIRGKVMEVKFAKGNENVADIFTKCLAKMGFRKLRNKLLHGDVRCAPEELQECAVFLTLQLYDWDSELRGP
jgi:hypothetical protein